jgi:hypothetical protein
MSRTPQFKIPPPLSDAEFPLTVERSMLRVPPFKIAPPPKLAVFPLTVERKSDRLLPSALTMPPPSKQPNGGQTSEFPVPPVIVRPTTFTVPEETVSVVPAPCASSVAGPFRVRFLETTKVPMHVPEMRRVAPGFAASIAGCSAEGFAAQSMTPGPVVVTEKLKTLDAVPPGVMTAIGPVVAPTGTVAVTIASLTKTKPDEAVPLKWTATEPVKPVPLIVTTVPTGPEVGLNATMVGAA